MFSTHPPIAERIERLQHDRRVVLASRSAARYPRMMVIRLDRDEARRIAVRAQLLTAERPGRHRRDGRRADGRQHRSDRRGRPERGSDPVEPDRMAVPAGGSRARRRRSTARCSSGRASTGRWRTWRCTGRRCARRRATRDTASWLAANERFRRDVLARLRADGPLRTSEIPDTSQVSWPSTGWTNDRNVTQLLEILAGAARSSVSGREGKERLWDLAERVYPADAEELTAEEARAGATIEARHRSASRGRRPAQPVEPLDVGTRGGGHRGRRRGHVAGGPRGSSARRSRAARPCCRRSTGSCSTASGRGALRLRVHPRDVQARGEAPVGLLRAADPARRSARREAGAAADRKAGVFRVAPIHEDEPFTRGVTDAVHGEIRELAAWLGLDVVGLP